MPRISTNDDQTDRLPKLKKGQFGACKYIRQSPETLATGTSAVNFVISFEDALKLNLAIDECVHKLGRYNRATAAGKNTGMMLVIHLDKKRIRVLPGRITTRPPRARRQPVAAP